MKKFFKSTSFNIIKWSLLLFLTFSTLFGCIKVTGTNYTNQYNTYKSVKDIEFLSDLKEYCIENDIHYSISNSEIKIFPNTRQELIFTVADNTLILKDLTRITYFEILENGNSSEIDISTYEKDGKLFEESCIQQRCYSYTFKDGQFYQKNVAITAVIGALALFGIIPCIFALGATIEEALEKRKKNKIKISKRQSDAVDDSKIQG